MINDIFKKCAEMDDSKYWKEIFEKASVGKFEAGYSFKNNILICKIGNQSKELILSEDVETAIKDCKEFFNRNTGLISPTEKEEERQMERQNKEKNIKRPAVKWDKMKKNKRIYYIRTYIDKMVKEKKLNAKEKVELTNFINYHLLLKNISSAHLIFENERLVTIENMFFNPKTRLWDIEKPGKTKVTVSNTMKVSYSENKWKIEPVSAEYDTLFLKEIDAVFKSKIAEYKFIPQSFSGSNSTA